MSAIYPDLPQQKWNGNGCTAQNAGNDIAVYETLTVPINIPTVPHKYSTKSSIWRKKIEYTIPGDTISQAIVTGDYYLAYTLSRHLFSGTRTAIFRSIESALVCLQKSVISQLVVDMEGLTSSYFDILQCLRQLLKQRNDIQIFILLSSHDEDLKTFISLSGPFYILSRSLHLPEMRQALLSPVLNYIHSRRIKQVDWEMVTLLLQGNSLKDCSVTDTTLPPHHLSPEPVDYRTGLPNRQRFCI